MKEEDTAVRTGRGVVEFIPRIEESEDVKGRNVVMVGR